MGPAGPNAIVSVAGVFVTRTTRDDAYDGMNVAWAGVDLPLASYFVYDLSLPSSIPLELEGLTVRRANHPIATCLIRDLETILL